MIEYFDIVVKQLDNILADYTKIEIPRENLTHLDKCNVTEGYGACESSIDVEIDIADVSMSVVFVVIDLDVYADFQPKDTQIHDCPIEVEVVAEGNVAKYTVYYEKTYGCVTVL